MKRVFFSLAIILFSLVMVYLIQQPRIDFIQDDIHLALYDKVKPYEYIKKTTNLDNQKIKINNYVNNQKLGEYKIEYIYQNKTFVLKVFIDDQIPPQFDTNNIKILKNQTVLPQQLVKNIQDDSPTTVSFKKDYLFDESKTYRVGVIVKDSYGNKSEKYAYVLVEEKDREPPTITGLEPLTILIGDEYNLKEGVVIKDDYDQQPYLKIDDSTLNIRKIGEYHIQYHVKDHSGNQATYNRQITVLSQYANREAKLDGKKVCYLTFDDGPSQNTPQLLEILDDYHIKASFFVTGTSLKHATYIKAAYQRGHTIGLHTYSHDYQKIYSSLSAYIKDLNQIKELVYQQIGIYPHYIRFPGGSSNQVSKKYNIGIMKRLTHKVVDLGYRYYDWTSINGDGENIKTVQGLIQKAIDEIQDQEDIMFLMHDGGQCQNTLKALPTIIDYLKKKGYRFAVIDDAAPTFHHTVHN